MGDITSKVVDGSAQTFQYDDLGRVIQEFDSVSSKTIKYSYNTDNKVKDVTTYGLNNTLEKKETYTYDSVIKDKILSIVTKDGTGVTIESRNFSYSSGNLNPPTAIGSFSLTWQGNRLTSYNIGQNISYTYNENGVLQTKTALGVTSNYHLLGDKLVSFSKGSNSLFFYYDETDSVIGFEYLKKMYFYQKDITGSITHVIDGSGNIMVKYIYDSFGKVISIAPQQSAGSLGITLANLNPILYKDYVYDQDAKLYFIGSRVFDTSIRTFLDSDAHYKLPIIRSSLSYGNPTELIPISTLELSPMFHSCIPPQPFSLTWYDWANPDNKPKWWQWLISGALIGAGIALCFVPGAQPMGVGLIVGGGASLASNIIMQFFDSSELAIIISSGLTAIAGVALLFTPFAQVGASMIGAGLGAIAGGFAGHYLGIGFDVGSFIGGIVGGILGNLVYKGVNSLLETHKITRAVNQARAKGDFLNSMDDTTTIHGNSLKSTKTNYGYKLVNEKTGEIMKYGESIHGTKRYSQLFYSKTNTRMQILISGTKQDISFVAAY